MRKRLELLLIVCALMIAYLLFKNQFDNAGERARYSNCQSNQHQIALAMHAYLQDYREFPQIVHSKAAGKPTFSRPYYGWGDMMIGYSKCYSCFLCPAQSHPLSKYAEKSGFIDYWLNGKLAGEEMASVAIPSATLMLGDGNDGSDKTDARYNMMQFSPSWLTDENSPMYRHLGGANYLMADGSVHWLKPDEVIFFGGRKNSFALQ